MALDPKQSRLEREREKAEKRKDTPLEPPFPFTRLPFDASFFSADIDPPKPAPFPGSV